MAMENAPLIGDASAWFDDWRIRDVHPLITRGYSAMIPSDFLFRRVST